MSLCKDLAGEMQTIGANNYLQYGPDDYLLFAAKTIAAINWIAPARRPTVNNTICWTLVMQFYKYLYFPLILFFSYTAWVANFAQKSLSELGLEQVAITLAVIKENVREFFQFYATFNYELFMVCPYFAKKNMQIFRAEKGMPKR